MTYTIQGKNNLYEIVIGCEIHAQINSKSKLFSRSATKFGEAQNSQVSLIDAAFPGMLPVINEECVRQAVKTGLGINAKINLISAFDRKNYFYPDLPQGYQISQFFTPIVYDGEVEIIGDNEEKKIVRIERIHLEQDAGKLIHDQHPTLSLVDLNRSGVGLMEIVSKPDLSSPSEAAEYVKTIRAILRSLESCDGDMEKGNLRCDANVSVRVVGEKKLGTRCEIKNLNSMRNIARAIEFEAKRQIDLIESGNLVSQETRLFDAISGETRTMRSKEDAMDYRYFPDPDLPPLVLTAEYVEEIRKNLPELPAAKKNRFISQFQISAYDATVITNDADLTIYFEELVKKHPPKLVITWLTVELFGRMKKLNLDFENLKVSSEKLSRLLDLISDQTISGKIAKDVLDLMIESGDEAAKIIEEKGFKQVSDSAAIDKIVAEVVASNQSQFNEYLAGNERLHGFFIGQIMKASQGQANPKIANESLINFKNNYSAN
jgi:aspartyl-tRNA(Asn)/glutamyl-tRNA(Gln) amidotransferase subunit B